MSSLKLIRPQPGSRRYNATPNPTIPHRDYKIDVMQEREKQHGEFQLENIN
jgi:hypothetical protein